MFLSVHVLFRGGGYNEQRLKDGHFSGGECFYLILYIVFLFYFVNSWGGCKSRHFTVYHMSKTWLQKVHGGREIGGVTVK